MLMVIVLLGVSNSGMAPISGAVFTANPKQALAGQCVNPGAVLDSIVSEQMQANDLPGLTLALVAGGEIAVLKGYGYSDLAAGKPVDPEQTLFPVGSVAKPVTWLALMQLVEDGLVDLDAPVTTYLPDKIQFEEQVGQPFTVANLMSHSAGFEDRILNIFTYDPDLVPSPEDYFIEFGFPQQVETPGKFSVYCNDCVVLAALIIEQVSGKSFSEYVLENIFRPLEMGHSTFQQELSASFPGEWVTPYRRQKGELQATRIEYSRQIGAGGLISTAADMANFIQAYLNQGEFGGTRVLEQSTVDRILAGQFKTDDRIPGMSYGWFEAVINGYDIFFHSGDSPSASSLLVLFPEKKMGLFLAYNRQTGGPRFEILYRFMDECFPPPDDYIPVPIEVDESVINGLAGTYQGNRITYSSIGKLNIINNLKRVSTTDEGFLDVDGKKFVETDPLLFTNIDNPDDVIVFLKNDEGNVTHLLVGERPNQAWEKISWYQQPIVHAVVLVATLALFFVSGLVWMIALVRRNGDRSTMVLAARWLGIFLSATAFIFVTSLVAWLFFTNPMDIAFGMPPLINAAIIMASLFAMITLGAAVIGLIIWRKGSWSLSGRLHFSLFVGAAILFSSILWYWNFLLI